MIASMRMSPFWGRAAWVIHRASGVAVLLFLLVHVGDTALVRLGPQAYDTVIAVYRQGVFRAFEILGMGAVLFHAVNGLRITVQDLWPGWVPVQRPLVYSSYVVTALLWVPAAYFMAVR